MPKLNFSEWDPIMKEEFPERPRLTRHLYQRQASSTKAELRRSWLAQPRGLRMMLLTPPIQKK